MQPVRRAIIDIGTNSVKLLVADVTGFRVAPVWEGSEQTRLGRGFYKEHRLSASAIADTSTAAAGFARRAGELKAESIRVIATSAAREARNSQELIDAVREACGLEIEVLSGEEEAALAFRGVSTDWHYVENPILVLEVGGGSSQFIIGEGGKTTFSRSSKIGTVRLMESVTHDDPPRAEDLARSRSWLRRVLDEEMAPVLEPELRQVRRALPQMIPLQLVCTGGTASILGCMEAKMNVFDRERLEAVTLNIDRVEQTVTLLWSLSLAERKAIVGLPPNRADVILTGAVIYEGIMARFGFQEMRVSTRGLRFGAAVTDHR
jgi:exopolyphosphatase/guanosine-5'-triphosphate,3'-diphosphate pyrophosphatase